MAARNAASVAPDLLLDSPSPVLFDEWQVVPTLWDQVRRAVDARAPTKGLYILTGSATPSDDVNRHSGAGRIAIIQMRPMSLMESGHSTGEASLKAVLADDKVAARDSGLTVPDLIDRSRQSPETTNHSQSPIVPLTCGFTDFQRRPTTPSVALLRR